MRGDVGCEFWCEIWGDGWGEDGCWGNVGSRGVVTIEVSEDRD